MKSTRKQDLRVLFVNRMAGMVRGGGETFDLEMARHLTGLGCKVTFLTGRPVFKSAVLGPEKWWGEERLETIDLRLETSGNVQHSTFNAQRSSGDAADLIKKQAPMLRSEVGASAAAQGALADMTADKSQGRPSTKHKALLEPSTASQSQVSSLKSQVFFLRSPWLGWFPWDKVRGGWRIRLLDLWLFERRAARWVMKHQDEFDVIQICELPELVKMLKQRGCRAKVCMRLPGPQLYPGYGKGALEIVDLLIASGTSIDFYKGKLDREVVDIPNGVDVGTFKPVSQAEGGAENVGTTDEPAFAHASAGRHGWTQIDEKDEEHPASQPFSIIYVARLTAIKNHGLLLGVVRRLKERGVVCRLVLVGSGPLKGGVEEKVNELGIVEQVKVLGEVPYDQLPDLYRASDCAVIASDYESFGFVALESMACGKSVVSTRVGMVALLLGEDGRKTIGDGRMTMGDSGANIDRVPGGLIVPVNNLEAMSEAILWMTEHKEERRQMGAWNRARVVEKFSWDSSAAKLMDVYSEIVDGR